MDYKLQEIVFPKEEQYVQCWQLFYRETRAIYDLEENAIKIAAFSYLDFMSYFNSFSLNKWKIYTNLKSLTLKLKAQGKFKVSLVGYHLNIHSPVRVVLATYGFDLPEEKEIVMEYPETSASIVAFEIETDSICKLYYGEYVGEYSKNDIRDVELSIVTTTFKKEDFIERNVSLLKKEIMESADDISKHMEVHIIDNGRTLNADGLETANITVHPNKNVGGSGGFARGMIVSMESKRSVTHVLLMDDDVLILPESIKRTYNLLKVLKPEYDDYFVSGAMLCYEQMNIQHEDVGYVHKDGSYGPWKDTLDFYNVCDILQSNEDYLEKANRYAGWWYCCIPMKCIKANGLPLPLFIRGDDVEFSLRNQAEFITMNGISVWHMGFTYKFNAAMELYQVHRNSLILQATTKVCEDIDFITRMRKLFRARVLSLDYNGAELILDAVEDFMKGPQYIEKDLGEKIMKEKAKKNEVMQPLEEFKGTDIDLSLVYYDPPRTFLHKWLYRITYNGHRLCLKTFLKEGPGIVAYDWFYSPEHNFWQKKLLAVNPHLKSGSVRYHDKSRYRKLMKQYKCIFGSYEKNHLAVEELYYKEKERLTSVDFWKEYLEI